ncbi:MAG: hypothetical protein RL215_1021, partial [Planctomycetota bacterium]
MVQHSQVCAVSRQQSWADRGAWGDFGFEEQQDLGAGFCCQAEQH